MKQGEPLSPLLFILFINDIAENLDFDSYKDSDLELLSKYLILFADDLVLFTTNPVSLQAQIDSIVKYSESWGLEINVKKTKICIFEKRKSICDINFYINGKVVEIVDSFTYLGIKFSYTGTFKLAVQCLHEQAIKAYHGLLLVFDKVPLDIKTKLALFNSMVVPILLYSAEIWGVYKFRNVDKLHMKFLKSLLGVKHQTPNYAVLGEFGRLPLSVICKQRSLKFWCKIMIRNNILLYETYSELCNRMYQNSWSRRINDIIDCLGFTDIRIAYNNQFNYYPLFRERLRDQSIQNWAEGINSMPKLSMYCKFKTEFCFEFYLGYLQNIKFIHTFAAFRLSSHKLEIEAGRFVNKPQEERFCQICNNGCIENEYHFLLYCPKYSALRIKHFKNTTNPSIYRFKNIMSTKKQKDFD